MYNIPPQLTFFTLIALLIHFHIDSVIVCAVALDKGDLDQSQQQMPIYGRHTLTSTPQTKKQTI